MKFPTYQRYKPSNVEWLGEVPEHWEIDRLKGVSIYQSELQTEPISLRIYLARTSHLSRQSTFQAARSTSMEVSAHPKIATTTSSAYWL
jgi:hypothetical protein